MDVDGSERTDAALIALGANLGDPLATLRAAAVELATLGRVLARSALYATRPVGGPAGQPSYLNAVLALRPDEDLGDPRALLGRLHEIERAFGRTRRVRWEARVLDLDLLAWGDRVVDDERLRLPHPRMLTRPFVLVPLLDVAPSWRDPVSGRSAREALAGLDTGGVQRSEASWDPR